MSLSRRWSSSDRFDDVFLAHYPGMVARAQHLVGRDRHAAEDLVHDTYVRLVLSGFDADAVQNVQAYLFMTLRNVHLSRVRRSAAKVSTTVSIIDHESVVSGLRSLANDDERHEAYDTLHHIVRYACLRKASSKAASVLVLRFFHGYYPSEIARIVQTNEAAVAGRLRIARTEARAYLSDPDRVQSFDRRQYATNLGAPMHDDMASIRTLRQSIFDARTGFCLGERMLDRFYAGPVHDPLDAGLLAHLVSCATCLDSVNRRLGLPLLAERDPSDKLGRGPSDGPGAGGGRADVRSHLRLRLENSRDGHPQELRIAVNGLFVGSQAVNRTVNEQRLKLLSTEPIGFVEVFDEYDTCLLYLTVEPPPSGLVEQSVRVALSDGRHLAVTLDFSHASPAAHVVYDDSSAAAEPLPAYWHADRVAEHARPKRTWSFRPVPLRFVIAGMILGIVLMNPRQTFAAIDAMRRAIVATLAQLIEHVRPHQVLPSRSLVPPGYAAPPVLPAGRVAPIIRMVSADRFDVSDLDLSVLTLEALRLLDGVGALALEQVGVKRLDDRRVHVEGVVDTEIRRRELIASLRTLPASRLRVDLVTIENATRRLRAGSPSASLLQSAELTRDRVPAAYEHVRRYLMADTAASAPATDVEAVTEVAVRRLSATLLSRSLQARVHGRTVRELVTSVSTAEVARLPPAARATWDQLVQSHIELLRRDTISLRHELEQLFAWSVSDDGITIETAAPRREVSALATRIFELASAHDVTVRRAFSVAADGHESLDAGTPAFRRSLLEVESLAEALSMAMQTAANP